MAEYGLIGYPLGHSYSKKYFEEKFAREGLTGHSYELFELKSIQELPLLIRQKPCLRGFNVTIPYKQAITGFLNRIDPVAAQIGAVNTVRITHAGTEGYNTDWIGFRDSLLNFLPLGFSGKALILGNGGSAQAVKAALNYLQIRWATVSRKPVEGEFTYANCSESTVSAFQLLINTTPLGMYPNINTCPDLPYHALTPQHFLFDLVYNPEQTLFLKKGQEQGAKVRNGLEMLHHQAEAAWQIWQSEPSEGEA